MISGSTKGTYLQSVSCKSCHCTNCMCDKHFQLVLSPDPKSILLLPCSTCVLIKPKDRNKTQLSLNLLSFYCEAIPCTISFNLLLIFLTSSTDSSWIFIFPIYFEFIAFGYASTKHLLVIHCQPNSFQCQCHRVYLLGSGDDIIHVGLAHQYLQHPPSKQLDLCLPLTF